MITHWISVKIGWKKAFGWEEWFKVLRGYWGEFWRLLERWLAVHCEARLWCVLRPDHKHVYLVLTKRVKNLRFLNRKCHKKYLKKAIRQKLLICIEECWKWREVTNKIGSRMINAWDKNLSSLDVFQGNCVWKDRKVSLSKALEWINFDI